MARQDGVELVLGAIIPLLPEGDGKYDEDTLTDKPASFFAREAVREQIMRLTHREVPHAVAVTVDRFEERETIRVIQATIHVEKVGQRAILVGRKGEQIKEIGTNARIHLEELLGGKVHLELFVRVTERWKDMPRQLQEMGYDHQQGKQLANLLPAKPKSPRASAKSPAAGKSKTPAKAKTSGKPRPAGKGPGGPQAPTNRCTQETPCTPKDSAMKPLIAIVGRPNVGKSTLFNRLVGQKLAIVHDTPGVTRDRHYADTYLQGRDVTVIDTGGFDPNDEDPMHQGIARHVRAAIAEADVILCLLDALAPPTEADRQAVQLLRKSDKPVVYFANRADNTQVELDANELLRLGIKNLIAGSALHGRRMADLELALLNHLPKAEQAEADDANVPKVALIGRPNAGKSSLLNQLAGSERSLVDHRPGTTRDPIDARITFGEQQYVFVDTAGVRRRSKIKEDIESASVMRAIQCIERSDLVVLMCDGAEPISDQDTRLLALATERGRAVIIGLNKMDLLTKSEEAQALEKAKESLHFAPWIPIVRLSAMKGRGLKALMTRVDESYAEFFAARDDLRAQSLLRRGVGATQSPDAWWQGTTPVLRHPGADQAAAVHCNEQLPRLDRRKLQTVHGQPIARRVRVPVRAYSSEFPRTSAPGDAGRRLVQRESARLNALFL